MDNIGDIVKGVMGKMSSRRMEEDQKLERIWENLLTPQELEHTQIIGFKDNIISIRVDTPTWMYHMKTKQSSLLKRLNQELEDIKRIRFELGKIDATEKNS